MDTFGKAADLLHSIVGTALDLLLAPFSFLPPVWQLLLLSILIGAVFLVLFGKLSNQNGIKNAKRSIGSSLVEIVLFRHDLKLSLGAQWKLLLTSFRYFAYGVVPALVLAVPCILLLVHLDTDFGYRGLRVNESVVVRAKLRDGEQLSQVKLKSADGIEITPPVRIVDPPEILWRVTPKRIPEGGTASLILEREGSSEQIEQQLAVAGGSGKIFSSLAADFWPRLLAPGSRAIDRMNDAVAELSVSYPAASYRIGPWQWDWLTVFIVFSLLAGIALSRWIGVTI